jgi:hypothetical protein
LSCTCCKWALAVVASSSGELDKTLFFSSCKVVTLFRWSWLNRVLKKMPEKWKELASEFYWTLNRATPLVIKYDTIRHNTIQYDTKQYETIRHIQTNTKQYETTIRNNNTKQQHETTIRNNTEHPPQSVRGVHHHLQRRGLLLVVQRLVPGYVLFFRQHCTVRGSGMFEK